MGLSSTLSLVRLVSSYFLFQIIIDLSDNSYDYWSLKKDYVLCVQQYKENQDISVLDTNQCRRVDRTSYSYIVDYSSEPSNVFSLAINDETHINSFQRYIPINIGLYLFKNENSVVNLSTYSLLGMENMILIERKNYNVTCIRNLNTPIFKTKDENWIDALYKYIETDFPTTIQSSVLHVAALITSTDINYMIQIRNMLLAHSRYFQILLPHKYLHYCSEVLTYSITCLNIESSSSFKYDYASNELFLLLVNDDVVFSKTTSKQVEKILNKQYYDYNTMKPVVLLLVASDFVKSVRRTVQNMNIEIDIRNEDGEYVLMHLLNTNTNDRVTRNIDLSPSYTSTLEFDFNYGINQAHLNQVCLFNRTNIAYFNTDIPAPLREILSYSSSGFYSPDGSSGYNFIEWQHHTAKGVHLINDTVVMMTPVFNNNIFHAAQTYMALVYAVQNNLVYVEKLSTIIVPNVHSKHEVNYCTELLRVIVSYVESKRMNNNSIAVLFQEDIGIKVGNIYCFQDLHLLGSLELALPLISSAAHATDFRNYVYHFTNSSIDFADAALTPNDPLKVTIVARSSNRHIMNLDRVIAMLLKSGLCDVRWLKYHSFVQLETMSFEEQVSLMHHTDVLISSHGAQLTNVMFLSPGSAVIEIMTAPWYEYGYIGTAIMFGVNFATVALDSSNIHHLFDCQFNRECIKLPLQIHRRDLECYSMRFCNANISVDSLEVLFIQASQHVRISKRNLTAYRQPHASTSSDNCSSANIFYQKSYINPLDKRNFDT